MVERYEATKPFCGDMVHNSQGTWVRYSDYSTLSARIAQLEEALREAKGHAADFAAAGMLIGENQNETFERISAKGKVLLKIIRAALSEKEARG